MPLRSSVRGNAHCRNLECENDSAAKELRNPEWMGFRVGRRAVEACSLSRREKQLALGVKLMVLDRQFDLVPSGRKIEAGSGDTGVENIADQIEGGEASIDVDPCHS